MKPKVFRVGMADAIPRVGRKAHPDIYPAPLRGFRAGMRVGEICALSWDDVDFEAGTVTVRRTNHEGHLYTPKGNRERTIPLTPELDAALRAYRVRLAESALRNGTRWLYSVRSVKYKEWRPVYDACFRDRSRKCGEEAGLPSTGEFHSTRHSFASHLLKAGSPITSVRDLLDHAELTTTNGYAHAVEDAREVIGPLEHLGRDACPHKQETGESAEVQ